MHKPGVISWHVSTVIQRKESGLLGEMLPSGVESRKYKREELVVPEGKAMLAVGRSRPAGRGSQREGALNNNMGQTRQQNK